MSRESRTVFLRLAAPGLALGVLLAFTAHPAAAQQDRSTDSAPIEMLRSVKESKKSKSEGEEKKAGPESWSDISPDNLSGPPALPVTDGSEGPTALRVQWLLDRARFSPGILDGRWGKNTEKAAYWLQKALGWEATGKVDRKLFDRLSHLAQDEDPVRKYEIAKSDLDGPFVDIPDEPQKQAELDCLCYESAKEALAERFHTTVELLEQLNPKVDFDNLKAGTEVWVPNVQEITVEDGAPNRVAEIVISKEDFYLHALDEQGNLLYHFPSTLGDGYDPSPDGELEIVATAYDPTFHYQPKLFSDVPDSEEEAMLPAGPNNPVGKVWMDLSKENYGIHGTSAPESIGYTNSHGCVRLTNWDALFLAHRTGEGTPVKFRG